MCSYNRRRRSKTKPPTSFFFLRISHWLVTKASQRCTLTLRGCLILMESEAFSVQHPCLTAMQIAVYREQERLKDIGMCSPTQISKKAYPCAELVHNTIGQDSSSSNFLAGPAIVIHNTTQICATFGEWIVPSNKSKWINLGVDLRDLWFNWFYLLQHFVSHS